jgi:hypothetical protein
MAKKWLKKAIDKADKDAAADKKDGGKKEPSTKDMRQKRYGKE